MGAFVRLLWIYLNRCTESATSMRKRLEPLLSMFLASPGLNPPDTPIGFFIAIMHFTMTRHLDMGEDMVIDYLSQTSSGRGAESAPMTLPLPDRATAVIRASLYTLKAIEGKACGLA
jgi:hypothetical protein